MRDDRAPDSEAPEMDVVLGQTTTHLVALGDSVFLHHQVLPAFKRLQALARHRGMDLAVASGYRGFERQRMIWNAKARGERPVLDDSGEPLDLGALSDVERLYAILRWSALPGASRHHWGTDMDVWDRAAVPANYRLQLTPWEYGPEGPFAALGDWLDSEEVAGCGFFRPYREDRGGIAPEPWHLSYRPVARQFSHCLSRDLLATVLRHHPVDLAEVVLDHLDDIFERFVHCPD